MLEKYKLVINHPMYMPTIKGRIKFLRFIFYCSSIHLLVFLFQIATIPTDLEQATGVERKELEAILAGNAVSKRTYVFVCLYD